jgi:diguanylate cyclase (GGDEF)-like protein/PAS domain S-box-containing protein
MKRDVPRNRRRRGGPASPRSAASAKAGSAGERARSSLEAQFEMLESIIASSFDAIVAINQDREIVLCNPAFTDLFGYRMEEVVGRSARMLHVSDERFEEFGRTAFQIIREKGRWRGEWTYRRKDGSEVHTETSYAQHLPGRKDLPGFIAVMRDIGERKRAEKALIESEERLRQLATTDSLTGIANRRHFFDLAEKELVRSLRYGRGLAMIIFDIDHFKKINDRLGHPAGDAVLQHIARAVQSRLRASDIFGRIGGEEFAVVLPECDPDHAVRTAERLRRAVAALRVEFSAEAVGCTISSGVAILRGDAETIDSLMQRADEVLYAAKKRGRNQVCLAA